MLYVEIVWEDAHGGDTGWDAAPKGASARRIVTVGQLSEETEKGYLVVMSYDAEQDQIGSYIFIPKPTVVSYKELRVVRNRGPR